jgi:hypothetical protein
MTSIPALATAWHPRGEIKRFARGLEQLHRHYASMAVTVPPFIDRALRRELSNSLGDALIVTEDWSHGRYQALAAAYDSGASSIHYVDTDRLIRWIEVHPDEWRRTVAQLPEHDCLVIGRTDHAWASHPEALVQTERITSGLFSAFLGQRLDLSAGSKGFSRSAAEFILANSKPGYAIGTDSEWVILAYRGGFAIDSLEVDGLDWEIPDRHRDQAASTLVQEQVRIRYDADPGNWAHRVAIANEIAARGLAALERPLENLKGKAAA